MRNQLNVNNSPIASGDAFSEDTDSGSLGTVDPDATQPLDISSFILSDRGSS